VLKENLELVRDEFIFSKECYESVSSNKKGVLRTIKGPVAEWENLNRNSRKYSEKLWDKVLDSDYVKEQKENKTLYGEANHPENRFEVDFSRVSHNIVNLYKVPESKQVFAEIDILDTPLGNVLDVLYEYGSVIGYSSRAGGVLHKKKDYVEVDEESYHFITFDAVPYPSVKSARPLNEGVESDIIEKVDISNEAHDKLMRIIDESGKKDKEVLKDFIYSLQDYNLDKELAVLEGIGNSGEDVYGTDTLRDTTLCLLKESYKQISTLRAEKSNFEMKLNDSRKTADEYKSKLEASLKKFEDVIKEGKESFVDVELVNEENEKLKDEVKELSEKNEVLSNTIREYEDSLEDMELKILEMEVLQNDLKKLNIKLKDKCNEVVDLEVKLGKVTNEKVLLEEEVGSLKKYSDYTDVVSELGGAVKEINSLKESYNMSLVEVSDARNEISMVEDKLSRTISDMNRVIDENVDLEEKIEFLKEDKKKSKKTLSILNEKVESLNETISLYENKVNIYGEGLVSTISSKYGINPKEVMNKLSENFSIDDIYMVCESFDNIKGGLEIIDISDAIVGNSDGKKDRLSSMFTGSRRGILNK